MNKIPTLSIANEMIKEAAGRNPGLWEQHSILVATAAKEIACYSETLDPVISYIVGLLHDIGRRYGITSMRHVYDGYRYLMEQGYDDAARICLTHSFPIKPVESYSGKNDCNNEESDFIQSYINNICYTDYDRLIQLCDALAYPTGICTVEKRLIDVAIRNGVNDHSVEKWKSFLELKEYFSTMIGMSVYDLFTIIY